MKSLPLVALLLLLTGGVGWADEETIPTTTEGGAATLKEGGKQIGEGFRGIGRGIRDVFKGESSKEDFTEAGKIGSGVVDVGRGVGGVGRGTGRAIKRGVSEGGAAQPDGAEHPEMPEKPSAETP